MNKIILFFALIFFYGFSVFGQYLLPFEDEWNAGVFGYIDETGKIIIPAQQIGVPGQNWPQPFSEGMLRKFTPTVQTTTFFRTDGSKITFPFESMSGFSNGISRVFHNRESFFVDINGNRLPFNYSWVYRSHGGYYFNEGIAFVRDENNRIIAIDTSGNELFELPTSFYNTSRKFSSGLLAVRNARGLWGYLDTTGAIVIPPRFALSRRLFENRYSETRANFQGNYAVLTDDGQNFYVINKQGEIIKSFQTVHFNFPLDAMFIHGDYLVYIPVHPREGVLHISNLVTGEKLQVQLSKNPSRGSDHRCFPRRLGENIFFNGYIISYAGEVLFHVPDFNIITTDRLRIWYDKFIIIRNIGYFTIFDETGTEITIRQ